MSEVSKTAEKSTPPKATEKVAKAIDAVRNQPTDQELAQRRAEAKTRKTTEVKAKTVSGGEMWDPEAEIFITGRPTFTMKTAWLDRQVAAKKIDILK